MQLSILPSPLFAAENENIIDEKNTWNDEWKIKNKKSDIKNALEIQIQSEITNYFLYI